MKINLALFLLNLLTLLISGCVGMVKAGGSTTEQVFTQTPATPTPLPACDTVSKISIQIEPIDEREVILALGGLAPGEKVYLIFEPVPVPDEGSIVIESAPVRPADASGQLRVQQSHLESDQQSNRWLVRVVHQSGVACREFTLPEGSTARTGE